VDKIARGEKYESNAGETDPGLSAEGGPPVKLKARYVSKTR
jgi:hypothetical protein